MKQSTSSRYSKAQAHENVNYRKIEGEGSGEIVLEEIEQARLRAQIITRRQEENPQITKWYRRFPTW